MSKKKASLCNDTLIDKGSACYCGDSLLGWVHVFDALETRSTASFFHVKAVYYLIFQSNGRLVILKMLLCSEDNKHMK